ncbi:MAG: phosphatidylserine decarboxylase family protein [Planctomycetes bacterium]|nr:phosphatidylserine decarboxylase family protein [Planctomycetota bacterium]
MRFASDSRRERIGATVLLVPLMAASALLIRPWFAAPIIAAFGAVWLWVLWFFRDPQRTVPAGEGLFVSPADGLVTDMTPLGADSELGCEGVRIGVFMSIFDVHVNRAPCDGVVTRLAGNVGRNLDVRRRDAWRLNESHLMLLDHTADGVVHPVGVRQVAGLVARRIVCRVNVGDTVARGERFGLIKFGSRLELLLPSTLGAEPVVRVGQRVYAGTTVLARRGGAAEGQDTHA